MPELARPLVVAEGMAWVGPRRLARGVDRVIGTLAEAGGAGLVLAEMCILFAGVVSRYVFDSPLMWTDELAFSCSFGGRCWCRSRAAPRQAYAADDFS